MNPVNLASVIVHYITFNELPAADLVGRPLSAYGNLVHNQCERRPHFEFGEFATEWGDEGAQKGWCLYKLGCKGPETMGNCPTVRYGEMTSWNVRAGHGCVGCMTTSFWNAMGPAYKRLPSPVPFLPNVTADMVGGVVLGGIAGVTAVHAAGMGDPLQAAPHDRRPGAGSSGSAGDGCCCRGRAAHGCNRRARQIAGAGRTHARARRIASSGPTRARAGYAGRDDGALRPGRDPRGRRGHRPAEAAVRDADTPARPEER